MCHLPSPLRPQGPRQHEYKKDDGEASSCNARQLGFCDKCAMPVGAEGGGAGDPYDDDANQESANVCSYYDDCPTDAPCAWGNFNSESDLGKWWSKSHTKWGDLRGSGA